MRLPNCGFNVLSVVKVEDKDMTIATQAMLTPMQVLSPQAWSIKPVPQ